MCKKMRYVLMFLVFVVGLTTATVSADTSEGLLGYWPLDEGAGTVTADASGNGNDGIIDVNNGEPNWVEGKLGMALSLDGIDDHVDCGNSPSLDLGTSPFTISAWIKTSSTADNLSIFGKGGDDGGGIRYHLFVHSTHVKILVDDDDTKYDPEGEIPVNDDQWHHIVGMRDATSLRLFIDGVEDPGVIAHDESPLSADYDTSGSSMYGAYIGAMTTNNDGSLYKFFQD